MLPVKPIICELETYGPVRGCYTSITATTLLILVMSSFTINRVKIRVLPPFCPNDYMLENKSEQDWKVYATAVREVMRTYSKHLRDI